MKGGGRGLRIEGKEEGIASHCLNRLMTSLVRSPPNAVARRRAT